MRSTIVVDATDVVICERVGCVLMSERDKRSAFDEPDAQADPVMQMNEEPLIYRVTPIGKSEPDLVEPLPSDIP